MAVTGKLLGVWQSRGGKYWLELHENRNGSFGFAHDHGGGHLGFCTLAEALDRINQEIESYAFDKIDMRRMFAHDRIRGMLGVLR